MSIKIVKENVVVNISSAGVQGMKGEKGDPNGTSGTAGSSGTSGTSGISGTNGTSGTSGLTGTSGVSGTDGTSGTSGLDGTFFGSSGTSGVSGSGGTSGVNGSGGTSGTSGVSGSSGTSGINGLNGSSGTSGINGLNGSSGTSGLTINYKGTSTNTIDFEDITPGTTYTLTTSTDLEYSIAQHIIVAHSEVEHFHGDVISYNKNTGDLVLYVTDISVLSGVFSTWTTNLDGAAGGDGTSGTSGLTIDTTSFVTTASFNEYTASASGANIADFTFTSETISNNNITLDANNDITLQTSNGDIILNADGGVYLGSSNAGNGVVTDGYLGGVIGDQNRINNGTGHTITDNLDNIISTIPSYLEPLNLKSGSYATTGSNFFRGTQSISGSINLYNEDNNYAVITVEPFFNDSYPAVARNWSKDLLISTEGRDITLAQWGDTYTHLSLSSGSVEITGSILVSGSIIPNTGDGTFTSSFTLGTATNAWKDLYISQGSIIFVNATTQATSSFSIDTSFGDDAVKYTAGVTASYYLGDGGGLYNLPTTTNWNKNKEYILRNTEQLTFAGDYMLENSYLQIQGGVENSIGEWTFETWDTNGTYTPNGNNGYTIAGPSGNTNASIGIWMHRQFDTNTTMSIDYVWNGEDVGNDWPIYAVDTQYPYEIDTQNRLIDRGATSESGTWTINVPSGSWLSIGVNTANVNASVGTLQITLPYLFGENVEYSPNKYFKKEGSIFIGGNLLLKDSTILNNGKISVGGEVILIGNSQIIGTGTII